jgi:hypothetical protein
MNVFDQKTNKQTNKQKTLKVQQHKKGIIEKFV